MAVANRLADLSKQLGNGAADRSVVEHSPAVPTVTLSNRSEVAARTEHASPETPGLEQRAFVAKAPSHVRATAPTRAAAAPLVVAEEETYAPLVDAQTYRDTLAGSSESQPAPVYSAQRPQTPDLPGSWVATYQQLMQSKPAPVVPRPPAGSPTRKLSSDDESELPELPAPILRR